MPYFRAKMQGEGRTYRTEGPWNYRKLIEFFVELHYRFFGRPNRKTWEDIMAYCQELESEWPEHTKAYRKVAK